MHAQMRAMITISCAASFGINKLTISSIISPVPILAAIPVLAIDGPSGTGKGTLATLLAQNMGWHLLDSGAMYRVLALSALTDGIDVDDEVALATLAMELDVSFGRDTYDDEPSVELAGEVVNDQIRQHNVSEAASRVAVHPAVRTALLALQHAFRRAPGLVADGRDMGSTVFPDAQLKFYLTASASVRAQRRYKQLKSKGGDDSLRDLLDDIKLRDDRDMHRAASPLRPAADAIIIDSSEMSIDEVLDMMLAVVKKQGLCQ